MAITLGTPTSSGNDGNSSGLSFNHTTATNTKCLVVVVTGYDSSASDSVINSVTWNGTNLTEIPAGRYRSGSGFISIWYKNTPAIGGPWSVAVTPAGTCTDLQATAIGLIESNASLTIVYDTANSGDSSTTSHTVTVSSVTTGAYGVGGIVDLESATSNLGVTTGAEISGSEADMGSQVAGCATATESSGSITITWSKGASVSSYAQVAAFKPLTIASASVDAIPITCSAAKILVPVIDIESSNSSPSVVLNTPTDDSSLYTRTPTLKFTGTHIDSDDVEYEVFVDTSSSFDSGYMKIKYVDLKLQKFGSPDFQLICGIGSGHYPDDYWSDPIETLTMTSGIVRFTFSTPIIIPYIGGTFHVSLERLPNVHDETNYIGWNLSTSNPYSGGVMYMLSYTGDDRWGYFPEYDLWAKIYSETETCYIDVSFTSSNYSQLWGGTGTDTQTMLSQDFTSVGTALLDYTSDAVPGAFYHDGSDTHPFTSGHEITYTPLDIDIQYCLFNDSTPSDPDSKWTDDGNAFDEDTTFGFASCVGAVSGTKTYGYLGGEGTNLPSLVNETVLRVDVALVGYTSDYDPTRTSFYATVYSSTDEELGTCMSRQGSGSGAYTPVTLTPPSGGWSLSAIQNLKVRIYGDIPSGVTVYCGAVQLAVYTTEEYEFNYGDTIYWKVRAKDPDGSDTYGSFSSTNHFHLVEPTSPKIVFAGDGNAKTEIQFDLVDFGLSVQTTEKIWTETWYRFNKDDFDGNVQFYWEVVASNSSTSNTLNVNLYDTNNSSSVGSITVLANTGTTYSRYRSSAMTLNSGDIKYAVQTAGEIDGDTYVYAARIIVVQDETATKTVIPIAMNGKDDWWYSSSPNIETLQDNVTTWQQKDLGSNVPQRHYRFHKNASNWGGIDHCVFEGSLRTNNGDFEGQVGLCDIDDSNNAVAIIETKSSTIEYQWTEFDWEDMPDGHEFETFVRAVEATVDTTHYRSSLRLYLTGLSKGEIYLTVDRYDSTLNAETTPYQRSQYNSGNYSNPVCYLDATGYCADNAERLQLYEINSSTSTPNSLVSGSGINWNSATKTWKRSSSFTPTSGDDLCVHKVASTNTQHVEGRAFLVVSFTGINVTSYGTLSASHAQILAPEVTALSTGTIPIPICLTCSATKIVAPSICVANTSAVLTAQQTKILTPEVYSVVRIEIPTLTCTHCALNAPYLIFIATISAAILTAQQTKILEPTITATFTATMSCSHAQLLIPIVSTGTILSGLYTYQLGNSIVVGVAV